MKYKLIVIAAFFLTGTVCAQDEVPDKPVHQLGINATGFIKQFLSFNDNVIPESSPYLITYKRLINNKGIRAGINIDQRRSTTNPNNGTPISNNKFLTLDARIGYEWQKGLDKRWIIYYGIDGRYSYTKNITMSSIQAGGFPPQTLDVISSTEAFTAGGGGVFGVHFNITKRLSFNAESTLYANYTENRRNDKNTLGIGSRRADFTSTAGFKITLPTSLFFVVTF